MLVTDGFWPSWCVVAPAPPEVIAAVDEPANSSVSKALGGIKVA